jgi:hypothetical protein
MPCMWVGNTDPVMWHEAGDEARIDDDHERGRYLTGYTIQRMDNDHRILSVYTRLPY